MSKSLVGFGHFVDIVLLLHGSATEVHGIQNFAGQLVAHGALATRGRIGLQPTHRQGLAAALGNLDRHLVGGATNSARFNLDGRLDVGNGLIKGVQRQFARLLGDDFQCTVKDALSCGLLAALHEHIDKLGDGDAVIDGIRKDLAFSGSAATGHWLPPLLLDGSGFGPFCAVLGTRLIAVGNAGCIERSADHVIAHTRQILDATAADQNDAVLLQIVANTRNVGGALDTIRETNTGNLAKRRVRLLGRGRKNAGADTTLLRTSVKRRALRLVFVRSPPLADQLVNGWHSNLLAWTLRTPGVGAREVEHRMAATSDRDKTHNPPGSGTLDVT